MKKILNIITGGMLNDGITGTWYTFCEEINRHRNKDEIEISFLYIEDLSDQFIEEKFNKLGYKTPHIKSRNRNPISYIIKLIQLIRREGYDIVHVNGSSSLMSIELLAAKMAGVNKRIAHSRNTMASNYKLHKFLKPIFKVLCNKRVACGKEAGEWLFGEKEFMVLHNGKNFHKFKFSKEHRTRLRTQHKWNEYTLIGHVGRFNHQKNHEFLIKVFEVFFRNHHNSKLILFGDGSENSTFFTVKEMVQNLGLSGNVEFMGSVTNISEYLSALDAIVFPSRYEGLPNVVLEWQACGLPSVISDSITQECKCTDLVNYLSLEESPEIWSEELEKIIVETENREANSKLGQQALKKDGFDIEDSVEKLMHIYSVK